MAELTYPAVGVGTRQTFQEAVLPRSLIWLSAGLVGTSIFDSLVSVDLGFFNSLSALALLLLSANYSIWVMRNGGFRFDSTIAIFSIFMLVGFIAALARESYYSYYYTVVDLKFFMAYIKAFAIYFIFFDLSRRSRLLTPRMLILIFVIVVTVYVLGVAGVLKVNNDGPRVGLAFINLNRQALLFALCIVGSFCYVLSRWPRVTRAEYALLAFAVVLLFALVNTASRGATASTVAGLLLCVAVNYHRLPKRALLTIVPVFIVGVLFVMATSDTLNDRMQEAVGGDTNHRVELATTGMEMFREKPMLGYGADYPLEMGRIYRRGTKTVTAVHNMYLQILLSFGIIGFIPWLIGVSYTFYRAWKARYDRWAAVVFVLLFCILMSGVAANHAYEILTWIMLGLAGGLSLRYKETVESPRFGYRTDNF